MPPMCYPRLELLCAEVAVCPLCVTSASAHEQRIRSEMICLSKRGWVLAAAPRRHGAHLAVRRETSAVAKTVWWPMASRLAPHRAGRELRLTLGFKPRLPTAAQARFG